MLIAQDPCSKENNIPVYVQQIFQKLRSYQNRVEPLLRVYKLKKNQHCTSDSFPVTHNL